MSNESFFNYGDIVRLKKDLENANLKVGDYGIVWAIYAAYIDESKTALEFDYEGTFCDKTGKSKDVMFYEEDVEKVLKLEEISFSQEMKDLWRYISGAN